MTDRRAPAGEPSLADQIDREKAHPLSWQDVVKRGAVVAVAGLAIYLVFPAITEVFASWPRLLTLDPAWLALAIAAEIVHFWCTFALQRLALRTREWFPVVTSTLAGNAITLIMPGGAAVGAAVQFRMLAASGLETGETVGGLAAFSLLGVGGLLALPIFVLPVILLGAPASRGLVNTAILGAIGFVAFAAFGAVVLAYDAPLRWAWPGGAAGQELGAAEKAPADRAGRDPAGSAQRDPRGAGPAVVAGAAAVGRPPGVRLPVPARRAARHRQPPASLTDPRGLRGGRHHRADPHNPRRAGRGGGEPDRAPGAGRGQLQPGRAGHARLPARLVLGTAAGRAGRLRPVPDSGTAAARPPARRRTTSPEPPPRILAGPSRGVTVPAEPLRGNRHRARRLRRGPRRRPTAQPG